MKEENQAGWYALFLSITQNITPSRALLAMEGRRKGLHRFTWEEFVRVYRESEEMLREGQRKYRSTDRCRAYQREYRRQHPVTAEQSLRRAEYLRKYRAAKKQQGIPAGR